MKFINLGICLGLSGIKVGHLSFKRDKYMNDEFICTRHFAAMLIIEYRIPLPLTVEEYQIA